MSHRLKPGLHFYQGIDGRGVMITGLEVHRKSGQACSVPDGMPHGIVQQRRDDSAMGYSPKSLERFWNHHAGNGDTLVGLPDHVQSHRIIGTAYDARVLYGIQRGAPIKAWAR